MKTSLIVGAFLALLLITTGVCAQVKQLEVWVTEPRAEYRTLMQDVAKEFEKTHPDIKVNVTLMSWDDAYVKWVLSLSAGNPPDITYMVESWLGYLEILEKGGFLPVNDIVDEIGRSKFSQHPLRIWQLKGKQLGLPWLWGFWVLHYRKDIFEKAGIKAPETWDDVLEAAKKLTSPEKKIYGIAMGAKLDWYPRRTFATALYTHGGNLIDKNGRIVLNSPESISALTTYANLFDYSPPGSTAWGYTEVNRALVSGACAMTMTAPVVFELALRADPNLAGKIGVVIPYKRGVVKEKRVAEAPTKGWAIFKDTKHPKEAKMFLRYIFESDAFYRWMTVMPLSGMPLYFDPIQIKRLTEHPTVKAFPDVFEYLLGQKKGYLIGVEEFGPNKYTGKLEGERIIERMVNKVVVDKSPVPKAVEWADIEAKRIYEQ
ncbi:MAG: sugar ABC transporter substrate-binding protein [Thermodesulfobacteriota bacterium]|jgi:multiple sugar transport system substrate-binding protein